MKIRGMCLLILVCLIFWALIIAIACYAQEEIDYSETVPDVAKIKIDTVRILRFTRTCIITLRYVDAEGDRIKERKLIYSDREDDPLTPENEFCEDYTLLMNGLGINKTFLKKAIKAKLNLD